MKRYLTRRHLLIAGAIVALVALAADQGWMFQPETSRAEDDAGGSKNASAAVDAPAPAAEPSVDDDPTALADDAPDSPRNAQLAAYRFTDDVRDLLQPTRTILAALNEGRSADPNHPDTTQATPRQVAQAFLDAHNLEATFTGPSGPTALVDGKVRREGDRIDGFQIVKISNMKVHCRFEDVTVVLILRAAPGL